MSSVVNIEPLLPIRDQKRATTCLAFTASTAHEFANSSKEYLSPAYLYGRAWPLEAHLNGTNGLTFSALQKSIGADGQIDECHKPYDDWLKGTEYPGIHTKSPEKHFLSTIKIVNNSYSEIRSWILKGTPVLLGLQICKLFRSYRANTPHIEDTDTSTIGGHAVLAVGISESPQQSLILIRNSWGDGWGNKGYAYITEKYITSRLSQAAILEKK